MNGKTKSLIFLWKTNNESNVNNDDTDELLDEAMKLVIDYQQASTSFIQRKLRVGFNRASRIMDELEEHGIISEKDGSKPRQVLMSKEKLAELKMGTQPENTEEG